jgi:hypothetical protein
VEAAVAAAAAPTHTRTYIVMPARPSTWLLFMVVWVHILFDNVIPTRGTGLLMPTRGAGHITSCQLEAQATLY